MRNTVIKTWRFCDLQGPWPWFIQTVVYAINQKVIYERTLFLGHFIVCVCIISRNITELYFQVASAVTGMKLSLVAVPSEKKHSTWKKMEETGKFKSLFLGFEWKKWTSSVALPRTIPHASALVSLCLFFKNSALRNNLSLFSIKICFCCCFDLLQKKILLKEFSHPRVMFQMILSS